MNRSLTKEVAYKAVENFFINKMICNSGYDNNLYLDDKQLWDASKFAAEILGG
jgi:hypothetical protein